MDSIFKKDENIHNFYKFDKILGEGTFAVVRKIIKKETGEEFAVKIIDKRNLETEDQMALQNEVEILSAIDHPNIVKLIECFDTPDKLYIVMELMTGGELFDRIVQKESFTEKEAADVIRPIVDSIAYCHQMGVAHRDLKPENILYQTEDEGSIIKISDFGLAKVISSELMTTACGTPGYVAPEIIAAKGYGKAVDYWSIGVIIYVLLCGYPPFYEETNELLFEKISKSEFEFHSPEWDNISDDAKDLIKKLLVSDPTKRISASDMANHPWIRKNNFTTDISNVPSNIKKFNAKKKFRKAQLMVIALNKIKHLLKSGKNFNIDNKPKD